jgi:hypothetical protein
MRPSGRRHDPVLYRRGLRRDYVQQRCALTQRDIAGGPPQVHDSGSEQDQSGKLLDILI